MSKPIDLFLSLYLGLDPNILSQKIFFVKNILGKKFGSRKTLGPKILGSKIFGGPVGSKKVFCLKHFGAKNVCPKSLNSITFSAQQILSPNFFFKLIF